MRERPGEPKEGPMISRNVPCEKAEEEILRAVRSLEYGTVEVTVHAGKVVQIERREKVRFDRRAAGGPKGTGTPEP
jgi:hypothetical protein